MNGMSMMLKALGIDPEEITKTAGDFNKKLLEFDCHLASIREQCDRIEAKLDSLLQQMGNKDASENDATARDRSTDPAVCAGSSAGKQWTDAAGDAINGRRAAVG